MCGPLFLTVAGIGLLSVGTCLGFLTAALFATGAEPAKLPSPRWLSRYPTTLPNWSGRQPKAFTLLAHACAKGRFRLYPWRTQRARCTTSPIAFRRC